MTDYRDKKTWQKLAGPALLLTPVWAPALAVAYGVMLYVKFSRIWLGPVGLPGASGLILLGVAAQGAYWAWVVRGVGKSRSASAGREQYLRLRLYLRLMLLTTGAGALVFLLGALAEAHHQSNGLEVAFLLVVFVLFGAIVGAVIPVFLFLCVFSGFIQISIDVAGAYYSYVNGAGLDFGNGLIDVMAYFIDWLPAPFSSEPVQWLVTLAQSWAAWQAPRQLVK